MLVIFAGGELAVVGIAAEHPRLSIVSNHYEALFHAGCICDTFRARK